MDIYVRIAHSLFTLYMILLVLRWIGPTLTLDFNARPWKLIPRLTDPLIERIRKILPNMGPVDFAPIASIVLVWFIRIVSTNALMNMTSRPPF